MTQRKYTFLLQTALLTLLFFGTSYTPTVSAQTSCDSITATSTISEKYGSPINPFGITRQKILTVDCDTNTAVVTAGLPKTQMFVYKYGYHKVAGKWQKITFSGDIAAGSWFVGSASAPLHTLDSDGESSVLAYICQKVHNQWKCGCKDAVCTTPLWQEQKYVLPTKETEPTQTNPPVTIDSILTETDPYTSALAEEMGIDLSDNKYTKYRKEAMEAWKNLQNESFNIYQIYPQHALPGTQLTITGFDFSTKEDGNEILWNNKNTTEVSAPNTRTIVTSVPDISPGKYEVRIRRDGKTTADNVVVWVADHNAETPKITSISPKTVSRGDTVTLEGTGFSKTNNYITTPLENYESVSSKDGTRLQFVFNPFSDTDPDRISKGAHEVYEFDASVIVVTTGGISNTESFVIRM